MSPFVAALRPALVLLGGFTLLTGVAYPLAITGVAQLVLPAQANGSLERQGDAIVGSTLIGQGFAADRYFRGRLSAAGEGHDASASAATNLAPTSRDLRDRIATDVASLRAQGMTRGSVPADLVTTSASGLDPHIDPEAAFAQVTRVARARGLSERSLRAVVERAVERPLLGQPQVNVLRLNRQLDRMAVNRQSGAASATPAR